MSSKSSADSSPDITYVGLEIVQSSLRSGIREFLPAPAMGNMRTDNPEYAAKYAAKEAAIAAEAAAAPVFCQPEQVKVSVSQAPLLEKEPSPVSPDAALKALSAVKGGVVYVFGPAPTQAIRVLAAHGFRTKAPLPYPLKVGLPVNPMRLLGATADEAAFIGMGFDRTGGLVSLSRLLQYLGATWGSDRQ